MAVREWNGDDLFVCVLPVDDEQPGTPPLELAFFCSICGHNAHHLATMYDEFFYKCALCGHPVQESRALTSPELLCAMLPSFWCVITIDGMLVA